MSEKYKYLTVAQVSEQLQIHWQTVLNYIKSGQLNAIKIGNGYRIGEKDLLDFIEKRSTKRAKK